MIEEGAQPRVVVLAEAVVRAKGVGHLRERLAKVLFEQVLVRHVVGHFAQRIHVVRKRNQAGLDLVVGEDAEGVAHHQGARDFAKRSDMRQAGRAVAGLEDDLVLRALFQPGDDLARLFERPGVRLLGEFAQVWALCGHGGHHQSIDRSVLMA